jgi:hypothetical protein
MAIYTAIGLATGGLMFWVVNLHCLSKYAVFAACVIPLCCVGGLVCTEVFWGSDLSTDVVEYILSVWGIAIAVDVVAV